MKSTGLIQLVGNLHQASKIHNLHQVCGIFGCGAQSQEPIGKLCLGRDGSYCLVLIYNEGVGVIGATCERSGATFCIFDSC